MQTNKAFDVTYAKQNREISFIIYYLDTSKFATGSTLYQIQNGKPK